MSAVYTRRVSFDSLNPNIQEVPDDPIHIPLQYLKVRAPNEPEVQSNKRGLDLNFGYAPSKNQDITKVFDSFQAISDKLNYKAAPSNGQYSGRRRKTPKLPPPPAKSILKKNYDEILYDDTVPKSLPDDTLQVFPNQQRKKSIVEMTPEELNEMDQQYRKPGVSLDKFEFGGDNYLPLSSMNQSAKTRKTLKLNNVDKLVGNVVTVNNKKLFKSSNKNINFKSYSVNFRHSDMTTYILKQLIGDTVDGEDEKKDEKQIPENLRDIIVYISGRKHTWDSINWVLKNFLVDGDHLIIISQLPVLGPDINPDSGFTKNEDYFNDYDDEEEIESEFIKEKVDSLSSYIFKCIELLDKKDLKISITIEFIKDRSVKNLIKNSINLYNPNFLIISSLISNRLSIKFENNNIKLPFYLTKNLNLSTIVIPDLLIDKQKILLNTIPDINIETIDNEDNYLSKLNNFSNIYKEAIRNGDQLDGSNSNSNSNSSLDYAESPLNYFPNKNSNTKIKFSDNLSIPRYTERPNGSVSSPSNSQFTSPFSSRRNSNNSSGIYKVKSLLDDDNLSTKTSDSSKSSACERSKSIPIEKRPSIGSIGSKKSKSIDEGTPKKTGFLAKIGLKKK